MGEDWGRGNRGTLAKPYTMKPFHTLLYMEQGNMLAEKGVTSSSGCLLFWGTHLSCIRVSALASSQWIW